MTALDDILAIENTLTHFAWILDHRAWERVGEVLIPDAEAYGATGIGAVVTQIRRYLGGCGPSQHLLGNIRIEVDGDSATSVTYARAFHQGAGELAHLTWECLGEYHDTWRRTRDGWRISSRRFDIRAAVGDERVLRPE